jgi:hypothetical protein
MSGGRILEQIEIGLHNIECNQILKIYIDIYDNSLSRKWLAALNNLLSKNYHLEKNYCFMGFVKHRRDGNFILDQINKSITTINQSDIGYYIDDKFTMDNTIHEEPLPGWEKGKMLNHDKLNQLHRYFEELQGVSGKLSNYYKKADPVTKWHIRQLNLLCHEFENWAIGYRKAFYEPEWQRPSQLMCWLNSPRFVLEEEDYELFGIDTINKPLGGVCVGVNKAVGKHHWEVFHDEGRDSRIDELTTTVLKGQTEAAGDFDIEWARNPGNYPWQVKQLAEFRQWLLDNGFDPDNKSLTIGHPRIGQVDLTRSFGTEDYQEIWNSLSLHLDVNYIRTSTNYANYNYCWSDSDYQQKQIDILQRKN